jgi:hypothetical protein
VVIDGVAWNNAYLFHGGYARIRSFGWLVQSQCLSVRRVTPYRRAIFSCQRGKPGQEGARVSCRTQNGLPGNDGEVMGMGYCSIRKKGVQKEYLIIIWGKENRGDQLNRSTITL